MSLLGTFIDVSAFTDGLTSGQSTVYAHGLPADPDFITIEFDADLAANTNTVCINVAHDGTNVTLKNSGDATSPSFKAKAEVIHSFIR